MLDWFALYRLTGALEEFVKNSEHKVMVPELEKESGNTKTVTPVSRNSSATGQKNKTYAADEYVFHVRNQEIRQRLLQRVYPEQEFQSGIAEIQRLGDIRIMHRKRAGLFLFTAGSFPLKRETEDPPGCLQVKAHPKGPTRFHYLSASQPHQAEYGF
jgi:hypothetical protein